METLCLKGSTTILGPRIKLLVVEVSPEKRSRSESKRNKVGT